MINATEVAAVTHPELRGALDGLKVLDVSDLARYKDAVDAGRQIGWGYYFPYLFSRNRDGRSAVLLGYDSGSACVYLWRRQHRKERLELCVPPAPMDRGVLGRCLERANEFNGDRTARVLRIDAKDAAAVSGVLGMRVKQRRVQYLYAPQLYANLSGNRYHTIRRNIAMVTRLPDVQTQPYSAAHAPSCRELLKRWSEQYRSVHGDGGGAGTSARMLELAETFTAPDLLGEVVLVDGRLAAFTFGGEIRTGIGCVLETKSDATVRGLGYFSRQKFLSKLDRFVLVNDGSDVGRAGLRQLKDSFRPIEIHAEYRGYQREALRAMTRPAKRSLAATAGSGSEGTRAEAQHKSPRSNGAAQPIAESATPQE